MSKEIDFKNRDRFIQLGITISVLRKMRGMSQEQLAAEAIGNMAEVPPRFLFVLQSLAVPERNGVHNEVAVKMLRIQVSGHKNLKTVAPHSFCECHTDLLCKLRCDVGFLKAEIAVIGLDAIRLVELLFHRDELFTGSLRVTVDALTE